MCFLLQHPFLISIDLPKTQTRSQHDASRPRRPEPSSLASYCIMLQRVLKPTGLLLLTTVVSLISAFKVSADQDQNNSLYKAEEKTGAFKCEKLQ